MFTIKFAGCGSAFSTEDYQSNILVQKDGKNFLIDCGTMAPQSLGEAIGVHNGNIHEKIEGIYISHLHADHIGGLEWIALCTKFNPACENPLHLYVVDQIISDLWNKSLRGGLETLEGKVANLTDFFSCHAIPENKSFKWRGITFTPMQTIHVMSGMSFQNSYGLLIQEGDGQTVFLTTDTQWAPKQLNHFYDRSDVIFHDCSTAFPDPVHAYYGDLATLDAATKKKMWLYHYQPNPTQKPKEDGFGGFVKKGQEFKIK
jgi:ribonuclease BN (tRNA processing enzyme)